MKIKYDKAVDALYLSLNKGIYHASTKITDNLVVDKDKKGNVLGIEVLEVTKTMPAFDPEKTVFKVQTV